MRGDGLAPACKQKRRAAVTTVQPKSSGVPLAMVLTLSFVLPGDTVDQKSEIKSMV